GRSRRFVLSFLCWSLRRLLELPALRCRSEREKEIEILLAPPPAPQADDRGRKEHSGHPVVPCERVGFVRPNASLGSRNPDFAGKFAPGVWATGLGHEGSCSV